MCSTDQAAKLFLCFSSFYSYLWTHAASFTLSLTLYGWHRTIYRWKSLLALPAVTEAHITVSHSAPPWFQSTHLEHNTRSYPPLSPRRPHQGFTAVQPRGGPCPAKGTLNFPAGLLLLWQQRASVEGSPPAPFPRIQHHTNPKSTNFQTATQEHLSHLFVT